MLYSIDQEGQLNEIRMGRDIRAGQSVQAVLEGGTWSGAILDDTTSYALIGCTVTPGFDPKDFEFAKRSELLKQSPQHKSIIERLTK